MEVTEQEAATGCSDRSALDSWHVLAAETSLQAGRRLSTRLLDTRLEVECTPDGAFSVQTSEGVRLPARRKFGYIWTTLGAPTSDIFDIPEFDEADRRNMNAASFGLATSAPRAIENFLDLGHFAFIHTDFLGVEPYTEIKPYKAVITTDGAEVLATGCLAYQPQASLVATEGYEVEYVYRVPHPYCAVLYKSNAMEPTRNDVIALFVLPAGQERVIAHLLLSVLDNLSTDLAIRMYQQLIFGQDKPILENQQPKRLPLDPRAELSVRADATSALYRRWLADRGVRYGTIFA